MVPGPRVPLSVRKAPSRLLVIFLAVVLSGQCMAAGSDRGDDLSRPERGLGMKCEGPCGTTPSFPLPPPPPSPPPPSPRPKPLCPPPPLPPSPPCYSCYQQPPPLTKPPCYKCTPQGYFFQNYPDSLFSGARRSQYHGWFAFCGLMLLLL